MAEEAPTQPLHVRWGKAQQLAANSKVQAVSDARRGGPVEIRYNRDGGDVMLLFTQSSDEKLVGDIAEVVGGRAALQLRKSLLGGDLVVHVPAQTYVNKLGGEIPGFSRQL